VGGGLLITSIGWGLFQQRDDGATAPSAIAWRPEELATRVFYPLTLPLTVGWARSRWPSPSAPTRRRPASTAWRSLPRCSPGWPSSRFSIYLYYRFADNIARVLCQTGTSVLFRLSSFIALCIGVQIIWNGVSTLLKFLLKG
jgi:multiple antibiotic resistance protein